MGWSAPRSSAGDPYPRNSAPWILGLSRTEFSYLETGVPPSFSWEISLPSLDIPLNIRYLFLDVALLQELKGSGPHLARRLRFRDPGVGSTSAVDTTSSLLNLLPGSLVAVQLVLSALVFSRYAHAFRVACVTKPSPLSSD